MAIVNIRIGFWGRFPLLLAGELLHSRQFFITLSFCTLQIRDFMSTAGPYKQ